jgi:hypothetical protein
MSEPPLPTLCTRAAWLALHAARFASNAAQRYRLA